MTQSRSVCRREKHTWFAILEYIPQNGCVTRIFDVGIDGIYNKVEEGFGAGITIAFGGLFGSVSEFGQKRKDFLWGNRRPIEIVRDQFGFLDFDDEGRLKIAEQGKMESLAFDMLAPLLSEQTNSRVIDARHKFAKKSYLDKFSWTPTDEIIAAIAKAILGKFF